MKTKQQRLEVANRFIKVISDHGRRFFHHNGEVSRFILSERGHIYLLDKYTRKLVYTHYAYEWRGFSEGGTLRALVCALRDYIAGRSELPVNHLGPWPDWVCGGDLWGYGKDSAVVREKIKKIAGSKGEEHEASETK